MIKESPSKHVLLVDDEDDIMFLFNYYFEDLLSSGEIIFTYAPNGNDALTQLRGPLKSTTPLVLSDVNMPDMNGFQLLDAIKNERPKIKTALMSAYSNEQYSSIAKERGALTFFEKPLDFQKIKSFISTQLTNNCLQIAD